MTLDLADPLAGFDSRAGELDASVAEHIHAIGDVEDAVNVLLDEQCGSARVGGPAHRLQQAIDELWGESERQLVGQQETKAVARHRPPKREHLLLTARQQARALGQRPLQLGEQLDDRLRLAATDPEVLAGREASAPR
jgi:hypothetical protein